MTTDQTIAFIRCNHKTLSEMTYVEGMDRHAAYVRGLITMASLQGIINFTDAETLMVETQKTFEEAVDRLSETA